MEQNRSTKIQSQTETQAPHTSEMNRIKVWKRRPINPKYGLLVENGGEKCTTRFQSHLVGLAAEVVNAVGDVAATVKFSVKITSSGVQLNNTRRSSLSIPVNEHVIEDVVSKVLENSANFRCEGDSDRNGPRNHVQVLHFAFSKTNRDDWSWEYRDQFLEFLSVVCDEEVLEAARLTYKHLDELEGMYPSTSMTAYLDSLSLDWKERTNGWYDAGTRKCLSEMGRRHPERNRWSDWNLEVFNDYLIELLREVRSSRNHAALARQDESAEEIALPFADAGLLARFEQAPHEISTIYEKVASGVVYIVSFGKSADTGDDIMLLRCIGSDWRSSGPVVGRAYIESKEEGQQIGNDPVMATRYYLASLSGAKFLLTNSSRFLTGTTLEDGRYDCHKVYSGLRNNRPLNYEHTVVNSRGMQYVHHQGGLVPVKEINPTGWSIYYPRNRSDVADEEWRTDDIIKFDHEAEVLVAGKDHGCILSPSIVGLMLGQDANLDDRDNSRCRKIVEKYIKTNSKCREMSDHMMETFYTNLATYGEKNSMRIVKMVCLSKANYIPDSLLACFLKELVSSRVTSWHELVEGYSKRLYTANLTYRGHVRLDASSVVKGSYAEIEVSEARYTPVWRPGAVLTNSLGILNEVYRAPARLFWGAEVERVTGAGRNLSSVGFAARIAEYYRMADGAPLTYTMHGNCLPEAMCEGDLETVNQSPPSLKDLMQFGFGLSHRSVRGVNGLYLTAGATKEFRVVLRSGLVCVVNSLTPRMGHEVLELSASDLSRPVAASNSQLQERFNERVEKAMCGQTVVPKGDIVDTSHLSVNPGTYVESIRDRSIKALASAILDSCQDQDKGEDGANINEYIRANGEDLKAKVDELLLSVLVSDPDFRVLNTEPSMKDAELTMAHMVSTAIPTARQCVSVASGALLHYGPIEGKNHFVRGSTEK